MGSKHKEKNKLPESQTSLVRDFEPKNDKQAELVKLIEDKEIVIVKGTPGSGKSYVALATALGLLGRIYKKIIIVKSVTTLPQEEIGFLKGDMKAKMEPFMFSFK